jgi:hypothetical protein
MSRERRRPRGSNGCSKNLASLSTSRAGTECITWTPRIPARHWIKRRHVSFGRFRIDTESVPTTFSGGSVRFRNESSIFCAGSLLIRSLRDIRNAQRTSSPELTPPLNVGGTLSVRCDRNLANKELLRLRLHLKMFRGHFRYKWIGENTQMNIPPYIWMF